MEASKRTSRKIRTVLDLAAGAREGQRFEDLEILFQRAITTLKTSWADMKSMQSVWDADDVNFTQEDMDAINRRMVDAAAALAPIAQQVNDDAAQL